MLVDKRYMYEKLNVEGYNLGQSTMGNAIYCGLCISLSADKADYAPEISRGKWGRGAVIDRVKSIKLK